MSKDLNEFLPYQLNQLATKISDDFALVYQQKYDLTIAQWRVIANLAQFGQNSAKDLCSLANMDKSTVSRAVKVLVNKNLVYSKLNENDKRAALLVLSEQGESLHSRIAIEANNWEKQLLNELSDNEYQVLNTVIEKLNSKLKI
ncbi:hypothetical protein PESP_b0592 [Pseudoalteromonas espejiana DSM 9414]|uniref:Transcriptional regulator n=1 Tax=Pseudoalteromonas espejiana TaxID=28107 RepID=A0A510XZ11_9GAMM|nr:MarR family transcriptional regulator [Pseudoalteromonas espejiana]ASM52130.1 hypothetical protein PESP_b0592 [Pseudoalteromonas espejiana DSM 9414]GEK56179.1 transcriptional regulator [Pseudoalteromonas espejiana]